MTGSWITKQSYGMLKRCEVVEFASRISLRGLGKADALFDRPVKNYGRFSDNTRKVLYLTALALKDGGLSGSRGNPLNIGVVLTDQEGCAAENYECFKDYVEGGRKLARSGLFVYTLPTSAVAEAAVHFGLQGPLLYASPDGQRVKELVQVAANMVAERQCERVLIYSISEDKCGCGFVESPDVKFSDYEELLSCGREA